MSKASQYPRPPQRRDAIAMSRAWRRRGDNADLHLKSRISYLTSQGASPESRPHISSIGLIKIAVVVANQPGPRRPTAPAQNFMIAEPGRGVFFVRAGGKARVRAEICRRPFPHIADHLTDAERAVARRRRIYGDASAFAPIQIRPFWRRMRGASELAPAPALIAPQFAAAVAGVVHEPGEFGLPDSRPRD